LSDLIGPIHIVGAGMLGTSIGLACRRAGIPVYLSDVRSGHVRTASGLGAGDPYDGSPVQLVVVAVPPRHLAEAIDAALATGAWVTDVGSVKSQPLAALTGDTRRYVGGHPMAGSERSGPLAASSALFDGRPWAVTPHAGADPEAVALVTALATACGAVPVTLTPEEHDRAVARTSHLPHLMAVLAAARLADAPAEHLALSGQGVRDVTRVAAGDPRLYQQIIGANAPAVLDLLTSVREELDQLIVAVRDDRADEVVAVLERGAQGTRAIPGKHGGPVTPTRSVFVSVPDHAGELARLFADAGASDVNIEDVHIDHDPGRPTGLVELVVATDRAEHLLTSLEARGWTVHR
jgi:prephenate dehydrogenase